MTTLSFCFPIINDYINQLEVLKRDGNQHSKKSTYLYDMCDRNNKATSLPPLYSIDYSNSWLLYFIGFHYFQARYYNSRYFDLNDAKEWFIKSANLGNTTAMEQLIILNMIKKDFKSSIDWFIKCIKFGGKINPFKSPNNIPEEIYDYVFELSQREDLKIKNILISCLPALYVSNKYQEIINNLKSVKNQGIDKVLINSILKHY